MTQFKILPESEFPKSCGDYEDDAYVISLWCFDNYSTLSDALTFDESREEVKWRYGGPFRARDLLSQHQRLIDNATMDQAVRVIEHSGRTKLTYSKRRIELETLSADGVPLPTRIASLNAHLDEVEGLITFLRAQHAALGHNTPPEEDRLTPTAIELNEAEESVANLRKELLKPNAIDTADPKVVRNAESKLGDLLGKAKDLGLETAKPLGKGVLQYAGRKIGEQLWQNHAALLNGLERAYSIVAEWAVHLHLLP